jgi:D-glycero-alpha-D-manno-heptose-7-phosphate kinase
MGGGSDFPSYYETFGGKVLGFSIDKYVYLAMHDYFGKGIKLAYSQVELIDKLEDIKHPIFRETLKYFRVKNNIEIGSFADVPSSGTGLGSSSAFTCALIKGIAYMLNEDMNSEEIAKTACEIELEKCNSPIGKQDQWLSSLGGVNVIDFIPKGNVNYRKAQIHKDLQKNIDKSFKLYYIGHGRESNSILGDFNRKFSNQKIKLIQKLVDNVQEFEKYLKDNSEDEIGNLLHESWQIKKQINRLSSFDSINDIYSKAIECGSTGGKVLGAGGGGFFLFYVPMNQQEKFENEFKLLREVPYSISERGTEIVYSSNK